MTQISELSSLLETLTVSIDVFKAELAQQTLPEPSLCTSQPHAIDHASYLSPPVMYEAQRIAVSCLDRLRLLLENPSEVVVRTSMSSAEVPGIRLAVELDLHKILEDAEDPEQGKDIQVIAKETRTHALKLEHIMRNLVTHGWFRETKPGSFANNRRSHALKKDSPGYLAAKNINSYSTRFSYGAVGKLPEAIAHPDETFRMSRDPSKAAWNLYMNSDMPVFGAGGWLDTHPEEAERFALGGAGVGIASDKGLMQDIPWAEMAKDLNGLVDVGGGRGAFSCKLAVTCPDIKTFVVQDLPSLEKTVETCIGSQGLSNRVKFQGQNFFEANQLLGTGSYIFVLQNVLHMWSVEDSAKILGNIRECLRDGKSKLLVINSLVYPVTVSRDGPPIKDSLEALKRQHSYSPVSPPPFIPQEFGDNMLMAHGLDACLVAICNSFMYTRADMERAAELAGMRVKAVHATR
ncbi:S-adenosyl-L-methionine-dependent methyltransferase [Neolentinus lepideus HHB14362 ss-1]|uniref:S-adenosyl-L-methionine-dependent methyltransferase n=1 Tax=Neolentinus lepideus HHB14362 ss-1 TaxID=1314782 RepID=A0A165UIA5_9AGAM|nr:S-adenosyl-L-methionine-dependent methyltransferase [Neolentinus lepideus HHB14362 ss-1]